MMIYEKNGPALKMFNFTSSKYYSNDATKNGIRSRWYGIIETQKMVRYNGNTCFGNIDYGVLK